MEPQTLGLSLKSEGIRILDSGSGLVSVLGTKGCPSTYSVDPPPRNGVYKSIRDNGEYIQVPLYSYYPAVTGWAVPPKV